MPLAKIIFRPGIEREGTQLTAGPGWYDMDKMRFRQGRPEKIGGWEKFSASVIKGVARSLFDWSTAASAAYLGIGTNLKFYVESGGAYNDITPIRLTTAAGDATFAAVNGDATLTVTENGHGAGAGDYVTFSGAASLGGNILAAVINHEYAVATVTDSNTYAVEATDAAGATVTANGSDTGNGGGSTVAAYQINIGTNNFIASTGFGVSTFSSGTFGGGSSLSFAGQLRLYSQDEFGDDLIFNPRGGGVYFWDESAGTGVRAVDLSTLSGASDTPTVALHVMVSTLDRHVICFGVNSLGSAVLDPLLVRWSNQESAAVWTPTATNTAGGQVLSGGKSIVGVVKTRQEFLIFTEVSIHSMRFSGAPFVYQFSVVSENISSIGPNAAVSIGDVVYFMGNKGFYAYQGSIQRIPCTVLDFVFSAIDKTQYHKVFAASNIDNSEVTWFYPQGSGGAEINRYVTYNYLEQVWSFGALARGAWIEAESRSFPIASSMITGDLDNNVLYNHEFGHDDEGSELVGFVESGEVSIGDGDSFAFMRRVIPDFRFDGASGNASVTMNIKGVGFPLETPVTLSTSTITSSTKQNHVRVRAREVLLRLSSTGTGYGWTMGNFRFDMRTDGRR